MKARLRRDLQRAGGVPALVKREKETSELKLGIGSTPPLTSPGERNKLPAKSSSVASVRGVQPMPLSSPTINTTRKEPSDISLQTPDSSPSDSRPSSFSVHSPTTLNHSPLQQEQSRPDSTYSSSSESIGRWNSSMMVPMFTGGMTPMMGMPMQMPSFALPSPMIMTYPTFAVSNPNLSYMPPMIPAFPDYMSNDYDNMMQMPLLPPTAPFMKQSLYDRRRRSASASESEGNTSPGSGFASPSSPGSRRGSLSSSPERLQLPLTTINTNRNRMSTASRFSGVEGARKVSEPIWRENSSSSTSTMHPPTIRSSSMPDPKSAGWSARSAKSGTVIPPVPPIPSPWTGVPTARQMEDDVKMSQVQMRQGRGSLNAGGSWGKGNLKSNSQGRKGGSINVTSTLNRGTVTNFNTGQPIPAVAYGGNDRWGQNQAVIS